MFLTILAVIFIALFSLFVPVLFVVSIMYASDSIRGGLAAIITASIAFLCLLDGLVAAIVWLAK